MKIAIGCDHGGVELKDYVREYMKGKGYEVVDFGTHTKDSCDYPEYGEKVALSVKNKETDLGILICGTGLGMSYVANKVPGIRCAACSDTFSAEMARAHNDANVLAFGARVVGLGLAIKLVDAFLETKFEGGRHQRRVDLISDVEKRNL